MIRTADLLKTTYFESKKSMRISRAIFLVSVAEHIG